MSAMTVSADGQAIALACSSLALSGVDSLKPLTPTDWNNLSSALQEAKMRPRDLLGIEAAKVQTALGLGEGPAARLANLLSRGGQLAIEVERLASRGIWIVTRADDSYPSRLREQLGRKAPPLLYGAGAKSNLSLPAIAIVGSRDVDETGLEFASSLGGLCAEQNLAVISGAARGVDLTAMEGAIARGGIAIGLTVEPLEKLVKKSALRLPITEEQLTLTTPFHPNARWHAGNAMARNRLVYALSEAAVVVASSAEKGGTRSGALENIKAGWVPIYVRNDGSPGNRRLISDGALPLPDARLAELSLQQLRTPPQDSLLSNGHPQSQALPDQSELSPNDAFSVIWPILKPLLEVPSGEQEIADSLKLELSQARTWLKRAVAEGRAEVQRRPNRYVVRGSGGAEQLRIDSVSE